MHSWQTEIFAKLNNIDLYVPAPPGAGKTLPYICYWARNILGLQILSIYRTPQDKYLGFLDLLLNKSEKIKKIVILVPIRSLAQQTYQEFKVTFSQILSTLLYNIITAVITDFINNPGPPGLLSQKVTAILNGLNSEFINLMFKRMEFVKRVEEKENQGDFESSKIYSQQIEQIDSNLKQLMIKSIEEVVEGTNSKKSLVCMRTGLGPVGDLESSPVVISIYESAPKFIDQIKDNIGLLVLDEAHLVQDQTKINEIRKSTRSYNIALSLYTVLRQLRSTEYRLLFLSGTANPDSAKNLAKYINMCFGRNINVIDVPGSAGNPSQISIHPDDSIGDERTLIKILKSGQHGTVIVLFSKNKINDLAKKAIMGISPKSLQQVQGGTYQPHQFRSSFGGSDYTGRTVSPTPNFNPIEIGRTSGEISLHASKVRDPLLRSAIQSGFGYIYRLDERERDFDARKQDNEITADLFSKGKIRVLLSTDAIGVGVNVKVRSLIIPSIEKPTGGGRREPMDPATLAQLLHRTGRGAFIYANIVTTQDNIARISHALSLSPEGFTKGVTIETFPAAACRLSKFFIDIWSATIGV
jgi:hypothetical protein